MDRGIQLFGSAAEATGERADDAAATYANRFGEYGREDLSAYRFYVLRPRRVKLFDERALGPGTFVTARVLRDADSCASAPRFTTRRGEGATLLVREPRGEGP